MSHWTKLKLQITDPDILEKALVRMGFEVEKGNFTISEYGTSSQAELRIDKSVGFCKQEDGTWAMVGDFYHASKAKIKNYYGKNNIFQQDLNVAYGIEDATAKLEELNMGFEITENSQGLVGADGMIRMVATSYS